MDFGEAAPPAMEEPPYSFAEVLTKPTKAKEVMRIDDGESRNPEQSGRAGWIQAAVTSWSSAFRVGFLVLLLLIVLVVVRVLALEVIIGPVGIGAR